jgi:hypothetical protein
MKSDNKPLWFKPLHGTPKEHGILAFDVEGVGGAGGFACGSIVGDTICSFFTDSKEMLDAILDLGAEGYWIFSHNLQYDLPVLEGEEFPKSSMLFTATTLLWADYEHWGKRVRLYDSRNLFPRHSARALGDMVGAPKLELPEGVLWRLSHATPWSHFLPRDQETIRRYVQRDAEIVYLAVSLLQDIALRCGGQLRPTIAGVSMDIYRRTYHKWPWRALGPETNKLARPAYYGGRVENFCYGKVPGVNAYDITSLYPSVQHDTKFPHPSHLKLEVSPHELSSWLGWEGVAHVQVRVPDELIPALPYRFDNRLFFPTGDLPGLWTILELRHALEQGYEVGDVDWVLGSPVTFNPFVEFVESLFELRQGYIISGSSAANVVKLILNSLYGRFGLNPEHGLYQLVDIGSAPDWEAFGGYETHTINGRDYAYGPRPAGRPPDYVNVLFAAQITAAGRLRLLEELLRQGENAVYCDTDSIMTRGVIETGAGLGDWRLELGDVEADLLGPKEYALHNAVVGDRYVVKGVPDEVARAYFQEGAARFARALGVREALRQGKAPATWVETYREHSDVLPKRAPIPPWASCGVSWTPTRPYSQGELASVVAGLWLPRDPFEGAQETLRPRGSKPSQPELL